MWERVFEITLIAIGLTAVCAVLGVGVAAVGAQVRLWYLRWQFKRGRR